jgi:predicted acylesterase/phospholipase RssA
MSVKVLFKVSALCLVAILLSTCALIRVPEWYVPDPKNKPWSPEAKPIERASFELSDRDIEDGLFLGLALSGGGSRAAVFGAEVMLALEEIGILQQVDVIVCASAGCLPAAYYALQDSTSPWEGAKGKELMSADVRSLSYWQLADWWIPFQFVTGRVSRTDLLAKTLDDLYFHGKTFGYLRRDNGRVKLPKLLIHAMDSNSLQKVLFEQSRFAFDLGSDLDSYPISYAVAASMAYPGIFQPVPLKVLSPGLDVTVSNPRRMFLHLSDGGIVDNLAISSLYETIANFLVDPKQAPANGALVERTERSQIKSCVLIVVDSAQPLEVLTNPIGSDTELYQKSLNRLFDYFESEPYSVARAAESLMMMKRIRELREIGFPQPSEVRLIEKDVEARPIVFKSCGPTLHEGPVPSMKCVHWHISLDKLRYVQDSARKQKLFRVSNDLAAKDRWPLDKESGDPLVMPRWGSERAWRIKTALRIGENERGVLFFAAQCLVHDAEVLTKVCSRLGKCRDKWDGKGCQHLPEAEYFPGNESSPEGLVLLYAGDDWHPFPGAFPLTPSDQP